MVIKSGPVDDRNQKGCFLKKLSKSFGPLIDFDLSFDRVVKLSYDFSETFPFLFFPLQKFKLKVT